MASAIAFMVSATMLCAAALLAIVGLVHVGMSSSDGIERDGLHRGVEAPRWSLADAAGRFVESPPRDDLGAPLQLILFADHSLKSFPSVVEGLNALRHEAVGLDIVILLRRANDIAVPMLRLLGVGDLSVVTGSPSLYGRYNVRVMPWAMFVDASGRVRSSSLVNHSWQLQRLWQLARIPLMDEPASSRRQRWRPAGART